MYIFDHSLCVCVMYSHYMWCSCMEVVCEGRWYISYWSSVHPLIVVHRYHQDWDQPEYIPDPDADKPEDWDDDTDGEWEPPMIPNPEYKVRTVHWLPCKW